MHFLSYADCRASSMYQRIMRGIASLLEVKSQKSNIASLDSIRALACLFVVSYHITLITTQDIRLWYPEKFPPLLSSLIYSGDTGVNLFFVLSGFLLFMPYAKALLFDRDWPAIHSFYIRRILRILPAYYVSLYLMILLFSPYFLHWNRLHDIFMFLTLFMDSSSTTFKQINGPFWTLAVEWQFYLFLPFLALGIAWLVRLISKTPRARLFLLVICLGVVIAWGIFTRYLGIYLTVHPSANFGLPQIVIKLFLFFCYGVPNAGLHGKFLEDFALGMLVSSFFIYARTIGSTSTMSRALPHLSLLLFVGGLFFLVVMATWKYDQRMPQAWPFFTDKLTLYGYVGEFGWGLAYALCVAGILFGASWLKRPFEWMPLRRFGLLSYGIYMWHLLLLESFTRIVVIHLNGWRHFIVYSLYWLWIFIFIVPCVLILFMLVEKPWIRLGDRFCTGYNRKNGTVSIQEYKNKGSTKDDPS